MARQFLVYWQPEQINKVLREGRLLKAASEQFSTVNPGDTLWICGYNEKNDLVTVGSILVDEIIGQDEANRRFPTLKWPADYHACARTGKEVSTREVSLKPIISKLRFVSKSAQLDTQKHLGNQLQRKRELTPESSQMLIDLWGGTDHKDIEEYETIQNDLDRFDELDAKRNVLSRREQAILRKLLFRNEPVGTCAICGGSFQISLLVAAHIKPRAKCNNEERRDFTNNVVPMCVLGCDALFERGIITVRDGIVKVKQADRKNVKLCHYLKSIDGRKITIKNTINSCYFKWHADNSDTSSQKEKSV